FIKNNFKHLTLDIFKGEILGIIGKNNSDKTLLLKVISGQYIPDSGKIFYLGNNMTEISRFGRDQINILKKFGIVNQEIPEIKGLMVRDFISLIHRFKLAENIDYAIKKYQDMNLKLEILDFLLRISVFPWNISEKKIEDLGLSKEKLFEIFKELKKEELEFRIVAFLENFNIPKEILTKMIDETSFVEQKLIILAAILSLKPSILILDEFDADMDIITKRLVVNNLLKINSQYQTTIIFSTHDPSFLKDLSHRSLILENGKITEINTPEIIYTKFLETMKNSLKYSLVL
ncbi:MAG: ATP-binding cassette domain-containing protein, partial [Candidatus Helarchaeota archaeon]